MPKFPRITGKELLKALEKLGFSVARIKGSHHFVNHPDVRATVIPIHSGEIIGIGLLIKILKDCEISKEKLIEYL